MSPVYQIADGWTHVLTDDEVFETEQEAWESYRFAVAQCASTCRSGGCDE